jgi:hypothetical protein
LLVIGVKPEVVLDLMGMGRWISSLTHQGKSELNVSYDAEYEEEFG